MEPKLRQNIERTSRQFSRRRIQAGIEDNWKAYNQSRAHSRRTSTITMTTFITNPYEKVLDLNDPSDLKLYKEAVKGLEKEDKFDGKKENFDKFQKLMGKSFKEFRCMEALTIPTKWDSNNAVNENKRMVLVEEDLFGTSKISKEDVKRKAELVWATTDHGTDTPRYFKSFDSVPTDDASLNKERNRMRMKHVILGKKTWASLDSKFQVEILGKENEYSIKGSDELDGPMLWDFIKRRVKPSTKVGAAKLKGKIEKAKLSDHNDDVIKFNTWFEDTRLAIIAEEGEGYNEYTRMLFQAYLCSNNVEFRVAIKEEERRWIQDKLPDYTYGDLLELGRITFNNLVESDEWIQVKDKKKENEDQKSFLALATEIMTKLKGSHKGGGERSNSGNNDKKYTAPGDRTYQTWRFDNPDNEKTKQVKGTMMTWCDNDCHEKRPMWCGRKNCRTRADHAKFMSEKRGGNASNYSSDNGNESKMKATDDFKIALAAMVSEEDFAALQGQFLKD